MYTKYLYIYQANSRLKERAAFFHLKYAMKSGVRIRMITANNAVIPTNTYTHKLREN